jgi:hypothetical protein
VIAPFDVLLDAALADVHHAIDMRCADDLRRAKHEAEHARRSLGQLFRWVAA